MAKTPTNELFTTLKGYFNQLTEGERTPTEVAAAFNDWARESAESVKAKIAEEVEATVSKMGFVKSEEYDRLVARVEKLEAKLVKKKPAAPAKKVSAKKTPAKKSPVKRVVKKSVAKKASR
jgi:BMFP domain-containing protein YqiC